MTAADSRAKKLLAAAINQCVDEAVAADRADCDRTGKPYFHAGNRRALEALRFQAQAALAAQPVERLIGTKIARVDWAALDLQRTGSDEITVGILLTLDRPASPPRRS